MMTRREQSAGFELKALYTVPELADALGMAHRTFRRWLVAKDVRLVRVGGAVAVPLVAFREAFPDVWASLTAVSGARKATTCAACGAKILP